MLNRILITALTFVLLLGCGHKSPPLNSFSDDSLTVIANFRDTRNAKGLMSHLKAKKTAHRLAAVEAFASLKDTSARQFLFLTLFTDQEPEVRKMAAYAIGQSYDTLCAPNLIRGLSLEIIPDIQKSILEAIGKCADHKAIDLLNKFSEFNFLLQEGHAIAMFRSVSAKRIGEDYASNCINYLENDNSSTITRQYAAFTLSRLPKTYTQLYCEKIDSLLFSNKDPDIKIALERVCNNETAPKQQPFSKDLLNSLINNPYVFSQMLVEMEIKDKADFEYLTKMIKESEHQIIKSTSADRYFSSVNPQLMEQGQIDELIRYAISSKDMALQSAAAIYIGNSEKVTYQNMLPALRSELANLVMPRQIETYIDLSKAICHLEGTKYVAPEVPFNHPIDWKAVKTISIDQKVLLRTNKGNITILLYVDEAPGSVWNFLNTVDSKAYDGRYFHRVVPNFVVQGGCPRGDGWGAPDWTQRSEFSEKLKFIRGAVGLASVGNDTEGVQFFITHCATPHLDGRYTIFGQVVEGMEVVDSIAVGDQILSIERIEIEAVK